MKLAQRAAILVLLTVLTGCDDEPAERRAFTDFLQTHIVSRPGVHLMLMKPETAKSFGRYASHYQIILDFNSDLELTALERVAGLKNQIDDLADLASHRGELTTLLKAIPGMIATVDGKITKANAARAALRQPPDLKEVYDKAFDRLVARPGTLLAQMLRQLDKSVGAMVGLADYVAENGKVIRIVGMDGTSIDPVVNTHLAELIQSLHQNDATVDNLKRQFQALLSGT
jgi:hypothetical protein